MWQFEQEWLFQLDNQEYSDTVRILNAIIYHNWDNEGGQDVGSAEDLGTCRSWCEADQACVQYSLCLDSHCKHFKLPRLGKAMQGVKSGWHVDRIKQLVANLTPC
ncbi:hypothetical protein E4T42_03920 [Aureobasidium subglaciale]|nr:hypothetical protein E4T42_03920 [Aureobasidium subglaciale]